MCDLAYVLLVEQSEGGSSALDEALEADAAAAPARYVSPEEREYREALGV